MFNNPEHLYSISEMSHETGFSPSWFAIHRKNKTGPAFLRIGNGLNGAIRYRWSDWEKFLASSRVQPSNTQENGGAE